jgi:hypothetical protein
MRIMVAHASQHGSCVLGVGLGGGSLGHESFAGKEPFFLCEDQALSGGNCLQHGCGGVVSRDGWRAGCLASSLVSGDWPRADSVRQEGNS